jgi:hypothetical protein
MSRHVERILTAWEFHACGRCGRVTISHGAYILHKCNEYYDWPPDGSRLTVAQEQASDQTRRRYNEEFAVDFRDHQSELPLPVVDPDGVVYWPGFKSPTSAITKIDP